MTAVFLPQCSIITKTPSHDQLDVLLGSDEQISRAITAPKVEDKIGAFGNAVPAIHVGKSSVRE